MRAVVRTELAVDPRTPAHGDSWDLIIRPHRGWWDLRLAELWRARDLIGMLVRRDLVAAYKQNLLGPLWHLVQPLLTTVMFTIVFGRLAALPTDGAPAFLFYLAGTVVWSYFSACLTGTANTFVVNAALFGKVYFPRLAVPVSVLMARLVTFGIQLAFLVACVSYYSVTSGRVLFTRGVFLLPLLLLILAALGLACGILISALTSRYRDLQQVVVFGVQLLMYATPVIYPASFVREPYQRYLQANPMTPVMEAFRWAFLGAGGVTVAGMLYSVAATLTLLTIGLVFFNRTEATFMDTV